MIWIFFAAMSCLFDVWYAMTQNAFAYGMANVFLFATVYFMCATFQRDRDKLQEKLDQIRFQALRGIEDSHSILMLREEHLSFVRFCRRICDIAAGRELE